MTNDKWGPLDPVDGQWERGMWCGIEQLTCIFCQWDTLEGIEAALAQKARCPRCGPPPVEEQRPSPVLVADKNWMPDKNIRA